MDGMNMPKATKCRSGALSFRAQNLKVVSSTFLAGAPTISHIDMVY
jgi:hypothetical protein